MTDAEREDAKDLAVHRKLVKLFDERDGYVPAETPSPVGISTQDFRALVQKSKPKRIKQWAEETKVSIDTLREHIAQPLSGLRCKAAWVKAVPIESAPDCF